MLGESYVNASLASADELTAPLQKLVTEWCWGEVWSRPGLERKTRSFLNLAMLTALNRPHEVKIHVRGALNNGVTEQEIVEVILQAAIYCGVPAAMELHADCLGSYPPDADGEGGRSWLNPIDPGGALA